MLRHIEALRTKPKAVRNQYAFTIALGVTLLIAAIWAISLPARLTFEEPIVAKEAGEAGPSFTEQLGELNTFFGEGLEDIKTQAEAIGVTQPENEPDVPSTGSPTDTAHYDFFPAPAGSGEGNFPLSGGVGNP